MLKDFKEFIMRGNAISMAVGVIFGIAFGTIINSLVGDILMPPIGLLLGKVDFSNLFVVLKEGATSGPYLSLSAAKEAGAVTLNYGTFIITIINFLIIAIVLFFIIKAVNRLINKKEVKPSTKDCPFCFTLINVKATRCPNCTSELKIQ